MAIKAQGTELQKEIATVFTPIADLTSVGGPTSENDDIDITPLSGTQRSFLPGVPDPGTVDFEGFYGPTENTHAHIWTDLVNGTISNWKVKFSDNSEQPFPAYPSSFGPSAAVGEALGLSGALKVSSAITPPSPS